MHNSQSPPMTAIVVIPHEVSAFEAALGDVIKTVGDVHASGNEARSASQSLGSAVACQCWGRAFTQPNSSSTMWPPLVSLIGRLSGVRYCFAGSMPKAWNRLAWRSGTVTGRFLT